MESSSRPEGSRRIGEVSDGGPTSAGTGTSRQAVQVRPSSSDSARRIFIGRQPSVSGLKSGASGPKVSRSTQRLAARTTATAERRDREGVDRPAPARERRVERRLRRAPGQPAIARAPDLGGAIRRVGRVADPVDREDRAVDQVREVDLLGDRARSPGLRRRQDAGRDDASCDALRCDAPEAARRPHRALAAMTVSRSASIVGCSRPGYVTPALITVSGRR